jgi:NAD(P)-dependent dehydrogenase (short-subunit alcohol dehydrogenase family)
MIQWRFSIEPPIPNRIAEFMNKLTRPPRLQGKVAIITGAGTRGPAVGTGQATAILFAREGARVLLADLNLANAETTRQSILAEGGVAEVFQADVSKEADCQALVAAAVDHFGGVDLLFNNVGVSGNGKVTEIEERAWDQVMAINLKSMVLTSKHAIPQMVKRGGGAILNVASVDGIRPGLWNNAPYAVSKSGVIALTHNMALHHGRDGVRVNCIAPGMIYSSMVAGRVEGEIRDLRRKAAPLGTEGDAWDIAWAALFLASDEARWITGVVLPVDGGLMAMAPQAIVPFLAEE